VAARAALGGGYRQSASALVRARCLAHPAVVRATSVFVYLSQGCEVETALLVDALVAAGVTVLVPRILDRTTMIAAPFPGWRGLRPGVLGILAPPCRDAWPAPVDVACVPGLAFTRDGRRLGYGGGYYDRWLAAHRPACALGLAFQAQVVPDLAQEPHDQQLDGVLTEVGSWAGDQTCDNR